MSAARRGGVVVRAMQALAFVPSSVAVRVTTAPLVARIAGAASELLGVALVEGDVVPVVTLAPAAAPSGQLAQMVVCTHDGERLGIVGLDVVAAGLFDADPEDPGGILFDEVRVPGLDIGALCERIDGARRAQPIIPASR